MSEIFNLLEELSKKKGSDVQKITTPNSSEIKFKLNLFNFPLQILDFCSEINKDYQEISPIFSTSCSVSSPSPSSVSSSSLLNNIGLTCRLCGLKFFNLDEQKSHFKTPFHINNLKLSSKNKPVLTQEEFEIMLNKEVELEEVDDNSEAEEDKTEDDEDGDEDGDEDEKDSRTETYSDEYGVIQRVTENNVTGPTFIITLNKERNTSSIPYSFQFSVSFLSSNVSKLGEKRGKWKFHKKNLWVDLYQSIHSIRNFEANPYMAVLILRSGKFAIAIYNNKETQPLSAQTPFLHKVLRKYTVRAKAGGGQSSYDSKSGKANSMGAQLRRYGEKSLRENIEKLLEQWSIELSMCSRILIATTKRNRKQLIQTSTSSSSNTIPFSPLFHKDDPRLVYVPFVFNDPTLLETKRIREKCLTFDFFPTSPSISTSICDEKLPQILEEDVQIKSTSQSSSTSILKEVHTYDVSEDTQTIFSILKQSEEEKNEKKFTLEQIDQRATEKLTQFFASFNTFPKDTSYSNLNFISDPSCYYQELVNYPFFLSSSRYNETNCLIDIIKAPQSLETLTTPLHYAVSLQLPSTSTLLLVHGADPTQRDSFSRVPLMTLSQGSEESKTMREALRKGRKIIEKQWKDAAKKLQQEERERRAIEGIIEERNEEKEDEEEEDDELDKYYEMIPSIPWNWSKSLIPEPITEDSIKLKKEKEKLKKKRQNEKKKELKIQLENDLKFARELLAKEEEEERKRLEQLKIIAGNCEFCKTTLYGKEFFDVYNFKTCSTDCATKLRRKVQAEAAEKRLR